jgi:hypothetical protein
MPNKMLVQEMDGTPKQIVFADHAGDFGPTAAHDLRKTTDGSQELDCQLNLENVVSVVGTATNTSARQSAKVDLGENRAERYAVRAAFEMVLTPTGGNTIELWWAPSQSATAGHGNPGGVSGVEGAYTGYGGANNIDEALRQLQFIGTFVMTAQATPTIQVAEVDTGPNGFCPPERYGSLVVRNKSGAAFFGDAAEHHVVFDPIVNEAQ